MTAPDPHELNRLIAQAKGYIELRIENPHGAGTYLYGKAHEKAPRVPLVWFDVEGKPNWPAIHELIDELMADGWWTHGENGYWRWESLVDKVEGKDLATATALAWLRMKGERSEP